MSPNRIPTVKGLTKESYKTDTIEITWIPKQRKLTIRGQSRPAKKRIDRNSRRILFLNQILIAKELIKECKRVSLTDTLWTPEQNKKNSRFINSPRKKRPDRNLRQILSLNQILKATALTKESNRIQ